MAAGNILAVVTLARVSGVPADSVQNQFVFNVADLDGFWSLGLDSAIRAFYNQDDGDGSVGDFLGKSMSEASNHNTISYYDITGHEDGSDHGSPVAVTEWTLDNAGNTSIPQECAAVLSFRCDYGTDVEFGAGTRPRARDRGRVYIGDISQGAMDTDGTTGETYVAPIFRGVLCNAALLLQSGAAAAGCEWGVWSRADAEVKTPLVSMWVDNAFDIQRRRGNKATTRTFA